MKKDEKPVESSSESDDPDWLGVKIRNLKVGFKTGGTWHWVGQ